MKGIVKWFNKEKGFGFLCPEDGSGDVFVHFNDIANIKEEETFKTLLEGQHVEFETEKGSRGIKAKNVRIVSPLSQGE